MIETGYWIHFDANRSHVTGMENVNVSYVPPLFVQDTSVVMVQVPAVVGVP